MGVNVTGVTAHVDNGAALYIPLKSPVHLTEGDSVTITFEVRMGRMGQLHQSHPHEGWAEKEYARLRECDP